MGKVRLTSITEEAIKKADAKGAKVANAQSAVITAEIEKVSDDNALRLLFRNGEAVIIPLRLISELEGAKERQLQNIEISPFRDSIGFPDIDAHIYVPGLLADILSPLIRPELSRRAGRKSTARKAAAVRENGKKGGRHRKKQPVVT